MHIKDIFIIAALICWLLLVTKLCLTICSPIGCRMPDFPVIHYLLDFAQIHVHLVSDDLTISSSASHFSFCHQTSPASESFPMSWLLASGSQSTRASASVLPMNIQGWFPLGLPGLISLLPKGLSRIFSTTTIWKHQFFGAQLSSWSNSHICTWLLERS